MTSSTATFLRYLNGQLSALTLGRAQLSGDRLCLHKSP